ncbi:ATP-binding protein [Tenggerimyces flavus]|uniref:ATP-binding protein n=1 Tax=Tenggerimyces flavus TaxID=1708749 RepID=A0ABV7YJL7_9ACTN|nr:ATP-binding protein [Tenggerimyces flavus]MBM7787296.1 hypothetical protein [Tenggerimyces flavus]
MANLTPLAHLSDGKAARIVELPRPPVHAQENGQANDPFTHLRQAAISAAYHDGTPTTWLWHRPTKNAPARLITAGASTAPPGSRTTPDTAIHLELSSIKAWIELAITHDALGTKQNKSAQEGPTVETTILPLWEDAFTILITAEPATDKARHEEQQRLADQLRQTQDRAKTSPHHKVQAERLKAHYRELKQAESTGLWHLTIRIGADTNAAARTVAALAVAAFDLEALPYALAPSQASNQNALATTKLLTAITKPPTKEVQGIRLTQPPDFDIAPEQRAGNKKLTIGTVLDHQRRPTERLALSRDSLNRHTFVCGATGAGKSQTVRAMLESATSQGIPWLVVEPAKAEYRLMSARLQQDVVVIRPGDLDQVPAGIDPLRPAEGFPLQTHLDLVRALFLAAFEAEEPFPQVLAKALERAYKDQGWDITLSAPIHTKHRPRYPTLKDLQKAAETVVDEIGYGREIADNVRGFIRVRLASLRLGTTGRFLESGHPIDVGKLLQTNTVLEIEDVADDRDKAFLMGAVLIALTEHLRVQERKGELTPGNLRHLTVFEEAHRLLRNTQHTHGPAAHAVEMFAAMLAEIRAYGEGLIVAEQIPAKLIPDVIKNTAVKIVHRLPAQDDRDAVGATMNLSPSQSKHLVTLEPGTAAVFTDGMDHPILATMPDGTHRELTSELHTKGPERVIDPISGRCASPYALDICTLSEFLRGRRLADANAPMRLYTELTVVGYLTGMDLPLIPPVLADSLQGQEDLVIACALAACIDDSVATRSGAICDKLSPDEFAAYIAESLYSTVCGHRPVEVRRDRWLAAPFRKTSRRKQDELLRGRAMIHALFGNESPSQLEDLIGLNRYHDDWDEAVRHQTAPYEVDWAVPFFATPRRRLDGEA